MKFKEYMAQVDCRISGMDAEHLRKWAHNYARQAPEKEWDNLLQSFHKKDKVQYPEEIKKIGEWCEAVEDTEIALSCRGYEDYSSGFWDADWIYEYEDRDGVGPMLQKIYALAERCVYEEDFEDAWYIYQNVTPLTFFAFDEDGGDAIELDLEKLVKEDIASLDLKKIGLFSLYIEYQMSAKEERPQRIYSYFYQNLFKEIKIEEFFAVGPLELEGIETFLDGWILFLRGRAEPYAAKLLEDAIMYHKGEAGFLEEAKHNTRTHPILFKNVLEKFLQTEDYARVLDEGYYAIKELGESPNICGKIARMAAFAAKQLGRQEDEQALLWEAFCANKGLPRYLHLYDENLLTEEMARNAVEKLADVGHGGRVRADEGSCNYYTHSPGQMSEREYMVFKIFNNDFDYIYQKCKKQKEPLGWSGRPIGVGVPLLLVLLYRGESCPATLRDLVHHLGTQIQYEQEYDDRPLAETIFKWKKGALCTQEAAETYMHYLQETIDKRVCAIVGGTHRGSYGKAALLGAALGEVEASRSPEETGNQRIEYYHKLFPRHTAFRKELRKYE